MSEHGRSDTLPPGCRLREHPLHFGETVVESDTAAAHGNAVNSCGEEPDVTVEESLERKRMMLLWQVGTGESPIQLGHELPNLIGCDRYPLNRQVHQSVLDTTCRAP